MNIDRLHDLADRNSTRDTSLASGAPGPIKLLLSAEFRAGRAMCEKVYLLQPPAVGCVTGAPVGWLVFDPTGTGGGALVGLPSQPLLWWPPLEEVSVESASDSRSPVATTPPG